MNRITPATDRTVAGAKVSASLMGRAFWIALLVLHVLALPSLLDTALSASAVTQLALVPRIAGLTISAVFFLLKFFNVPWLHMRPGWRSWVAAVLIVCLLHVGVVDRAVTGDMTSSAAQMPWLVASALLGTIVLVRRLLADLAIRATGGHQAPADPFRPSLARAGAFCWRPHETLSHVLFAALRAPPAC